MESLLQTTSLWTPEQAAAFSNACTTLYEQVWLPLQVPEWQQWWTTLQQAVLDSRQAAVSLASFWFLTLRPAVLLMSMLLQAAARAFWKYVLVQGISQQGVQYLTTACKAVVKHQQSLTRRQVAMEVGAVVATFVVYKVFKMLQRQQYFSRFSAWTVVQKTRAKNYYRQSKETVVQCYDRSVQSIATTSVLAAVMTPHVIFLVGAVALKMLFPTLVTWLACETACLSLLKSWYPLVATFFVLQHANKKGRRKKAAETKESELYWLDFWTVRAACQALKQFLFLLPLFQRFGARPLQQVELAFYLWIFVVPCLIPDLANAPEARPLAKLAPAARRAATSLYRSMNVFPASWWRDWPVRWTGIVLDVAVLMRVVLKRETADQIRAVVEQGQSYLIPVAMLFFPVSLLSWFGIFFVQYVVPMQQTKQAAAKRSSSAKRQHMLRYWFFHCPISALIASASSILWWIPFSKVATFGVFLVLIKWEGLVERWFVELVHDLEAVRHACLDENDDEQERRALDQTWMARAFRMLLEQLPRAQDAVNNDDEVVEEIEHETPNDDDDDGANSKALEQNEPQRPPPAAASNESADDDDIDDDISKERDESFDDLDDEDYVGLGDEPDDALMGDDYYKNNMGDNELDNDLGKENSILSNLIQEEERPAPQKLRRSTRSSKKKQTS